MNRTKYFFATLVICALSMQFAYAQPTCVAPEIQQDIVVDITGVELYGLEGDPDNVVMLICNAALANGEVSHVGWDNVLLDPVGASWCSEGQFVFNGGELLLTPHIGDDDVGPCDVSGSGGLIALADVAIPNLMADADGCITLEFVDTFDDFAGAVDAVWASGVITLAGCGEPVPTVPTVGEWGVIVLGLFIMIAGVVFIRTRETQLMTEAVKA